MHFTSLYIVLLFCFLLCNKFAYADAYKRRLIDTERAELSLTDDKAFEKGRKFIRMDSTYYVGYMFQGTFIFDKAADYQGYRMAALPLKKAFLLIDKEYRKVLSKIYNDQFAFVQNLQRYQDFMSVSGSLYYSYSNLEEADSAMWVLQTVEQYKFKRDFLDIYQRKAWQFHRNRFYTSKEFPFLKNSIEENEKAALQECYKGLSFIKKNCTQNKLWFGEGACRQDRLNIYHYMALIHNYLRNYDSTEYYYQLQRDAGSFSHNNYGLFNLELGKFQIAQDELNISLQNFPGDKRLEEYYIYMPMLEIYKGNSYKAEQLSKEIIQQNGAATGYGWYNISLARAYLFNGNLDSCEYVLERAKNFKEVHIGTTLSQKQYELSINTLKLMLINKRQALVKYFHKHWYFSLSATWQLIKLYVEEKLLMFTVINQLSNSLERERELYEIFCGESTISFYEISFLMKECSPAFFLKKMKQKLNDSKRPEVNKYYRLIMAQLYMEQGKNKAAQKELSFLEEDSIDYENEKLFEYQLNEVKYHIYQDAENNQEAQQELQNMALLFPQLMPFSNIMLPVSINIISKDKTIQSECRKKIAAMNIDSEKNSPLVTASVTINKSTKEGYIANIEFTDLEGNTNTSNNTITFKNAEQGSQAIALKIWGIPRK